MINIIEADRDWIECDLCGSRNNVVYIEMTDGKDSKRFKLCMEHQKLLKNKL